jgi:CheY-like chemotaxis protein
MTDLQKSLKALRILAAEDNELNRMVLQVILKKCEVVVTIAHNGQEAINLIQEQDFDLVLMDVQMPNMNGYEATKKIRELQTTRIPIIALTAGTVVGEKEKCLEVGMDDYASKPIIKDTLELVIAKWVSIT